jgi:hypothetical protein
MWELICHQTYDWHGMPIDHSVYHTDGQATDVQTLGAGVASPTGAVNFPTRHSRITIPPGPAWQPLDAIKIECTARILDPMHDGIPRTLIAGDGSFDFYSRFGALSVAIAPSTVADASASGYRVPNNKWVTLGFVHDGSAVHIVADGHEVHVQEAAVNVAPIGPKGVNIGNKPNASESIRGDIDEIKVWRRDPRTMWHDFASRPINRKSANCLADFLQRLNELLRAHPECATRFHSGLRQVLERMTQTLGSHGPATRARAGALSGRYRALWRKGQIDGVAMASLIAEWTAWMRSLNLEPMTDAEFRVLLQDPCFRILVEGSSGLECDKRFAGYLRLWAAHAHASTSHSAV